MNFKQYGAGNKPHEVNCVREGDNRAFDIACPDQASAKMTSFAERGKGCFPSLSTKM